MSPSILAAVVLFAFASDSVLAQSGCLAFQNSEICTNNNNYVFRATTFYNSTKGFDDFNKQRREDNPTYIKSWQSLYGCPRWDGSGLRYRFSVLCATAVDQAVFPQKWGINQYAACKGTTSVITPICKSTCDTARKSFEAIFNNSAFCDPVTSITAQQASSRSLTIQIHNTLCAELIPDQTTCFNGNIPLEEKTCGFFRSSDSRAYCKTTAGSTDPCCGQQGPNVGLIVGLVIGGVVLVGGAVFAYLYLQKRKYNNRKTQRFSVTKPSMFSFLSKPKSKAADYPSEMNDRGSKGFTIYGAPPKIGTLNFSNQPAISSSFGDYGNNNPANPFSDRYSTQNLPQNRPPIESVYDPTADYTNSMYGGPDNRNTISQDNMYPTGVKKGTSAVTKSILKPTQGTAEYVEKKFDEEKAKKRQSAIPELDGKRVKVIAKYDANLEDELILSVGDIILVDETFDDGWATGTNLTTGQEGCFPMACCVAESVTSELPKKINKRVSSYIAK
ncbi:hypothetical protein HK098_002300 [Nowakowskiella sp. JEL0407]|nr:hypothetical protein HK098_002300 [Nowakowskiella sp. JEL0407]